MTTFMQEVIDLSDVPRRTDVPVCTNMTRCKKEIFKFQRHFLRVTITVLLCSHPDRLTERELVDVTTVFHAFESGVRSGTMHQDWLKEVSKVLEFALFFAPPGDEHARTEPQRAGSD